MLVLGDQFIVGILQIPQLILSLLYNHLDFTNKTLRPNSVYGKDLINHKHSFLMLRNSFVQNCLQEVLVLGYITDQHQILLKHTHQSESPLLEQAVVLYPLLFL